MPFDNSQFETQESGLNKEYQKKTR